MEVDKVNKENNKVLEKVAKKFQFFWVLFPFFGRIFSQNWMLEY